MSWSGGHPVVFEVNTAVWLQERSRSADRRVTLGEVAGTDWDEITPHGVDAVWLMGVWERSPAGLQIARGNPALQASFRESLPDLADRDVIGSPYCVRRYAVDPDFGGPDALVAARNALAERGVKLLLDYVPNHVAPDHPWTSEHPEWFVRGAAEDLAGDPAGWVEVGGEVLAHGRDPYFPPWPDVVQLDGFSPGTRQATIETLSTIAEQCDGIRCDMAMLLTNEVFSRTWQGRTGPAPEEEFWPAVIGALRSRHPDTVLVAEAYWDMEWTLQQQGFDYCYDKRLYDRILEGGPASLRGHLGADIAYQTRLLRFLENHDEPRIAEHLGPAPERAAGLMIATLPGMTLWHEGQFEGRRARPPVFLQRRPDEVPDTSLTSWYHELLAAVGAGVRTGDWELLEVDGWADNRSCENLLAWTWSGDPGHRRHVTSVNWSGEPAQGRVRLRWDGLGGRTWQLTDLLSGAVYERDGAEMADVGLFVDLPPWAFHLLEVH